MATSTILHPRSHLINGSREGTASAVPKSPANSGVLTPEVRGMVARSIYETGSSPTTHRTEGGVLPAAYLEPRWYAAYTSANHEKRVAVQLGQRSVEHYLPLYDSVRRWKDRRVQLQLPLFPGYVFAHFALRDRLQVLQIPGVAKLVSFNGIPAALPQQEIEALRASLDSGLRAEPHPYLKVGRRARVKSGPLQGMQGVLVRKKNRTRFVISLDLIMRSVAVEIDVAELQPVT